MKVKVGKTLGIKLLGLVLDNTATYWVTEKARCGEEDEQLILDMVVTKGMEPVGELGYKYPSGNSDHVVIEMELKGDQVESKEHY